MSELVLKWYLENILDTAEDTGSEYLTCYIMKDDFKELCLLLAKYGRWKREGVDGAEMDFADMPECCRQYAARAILHTSGKTPDFACLQCWHIWERTSPVDASLVHKINILKGKV